MADLRAKFRDWSAFGRLWADTTCDLRPTLTADAAAAYAAAAYAARQPDREILLPPDTIAALLETTTRAHP